MVLPEAYGFSNSVSVSHMGNNLRSDPKSMLAVTTASARRIANTYLLSIQPSVSSEDTSLDISVDKLFENNLRLKITPISMINYRLSRPKFAIEKSYANSQFSILTDGNSTNFEFSDYSGKNIGKSIKLFIEPGNLGIVPKI